MTYTNTSPRDADAEMGAFYTSSNAADLAVVFEPMAENDSAYAFTGEDGENYLVIVEDDGQILVAGPALNAVLVFADWVRSWGLDLVAA